MKRYLPYILGSILLIALVSIAVNSSMNRPRKMNEHLSYRIRDKIPYGYYASYTLLKGLFPSATISTDRNQPGSWDSVSNYSSNQAVIIVAPFLGAYEYELNKLAEFARNGNHVFIITRTLSAEAQSYFNLRRNFANAEEVYSEKDSLIVKLSSPPYASNQAFAYPGKKMASSVTMADPSRTLVLGNNKWDQPNFVQFKVGSGNITIHFAPLAFSNYFILHKNNIDFYRKAFSVFPSDVKAIVWNEYYFTKSYYSGNNNKEKEPKWLAVLFRYPEFRWALLIALATLLIFVLLGMRRRQRAIPSHPKLKNESLDFVRTVGRLYYDQRDHINLARKMAVYFKEYVRQHYKLPTHEMNESFTDALHFKSGYPKDKLNEIVSFILYVYDANNISEEELYIFHRQLEMFYQNT